MIKNFIIGFLSIIVIILSVIIFKKQNEIILCEQSKVNIVSGIYENVHRENMKQINAIYQKMYLQNTEIVKNNTEKEMILNLTKW